ncbi:hypothetical protein ACFL7E_04235 [Thermodesulfobacteriota bacterium]
MKDTFKDIIDIDDVQGVLLISFDGKLIFKQFLSNAPANINNLNWPILTQSLENIQEAEFIFENTRFYIRRTGKGYIFVVMGERALIEMVRLNCDILFPSMEQTRKKSKGLGHFFKLR